MVGGYAVSLYGYVRYSADMDIWILSYKTNALKLQKFSGTLIYLMQKSYFQSLFQINLKLYCNSLNLSQIRGIFVNAWCA